MLSLLNWYSKRYDITSEALTDIRVLIALSDTSDPAETLEKIKTRLEQTKKDLDHEREKEKETE